MSKIQNGDELTNICNLFSKINLSELPLEDQFEVAQATVAFAETMKKVIARNADKISDRESFIVRL